MRLPVRRLCAEKLLAFISTFYSAHYPICKGLLFSDIPVASPILLLLF